MEDEAEVLGAFLLGYRTPMYPAHTICGTAVYFLLRRAIRQAMAGDSAQDGHDPSQEVQVTCPGLMPNPGP
jgi:hypothetical protein